MKLNINQINEILASPMPITLRELSMLMDKTPTTIWRWYKTGIIKTKKVGTCMHVTKDEVRRLLKIEPITHRGMYDEVHESGVTVKRSKRK